MPDLYGSQQRFKMIPTQTGIKNKIGRRDLTWAVLGGSSLGLSFPPIGWFLFAWIAFVPLFRICIRHSTRDTFILAWVFHVAMVSVAFYWPVLHIRTDTAVFSLIAMVSLTMLLAIPFAVASAISVKTARSLDSGSPGVIFLAGLLVVVLDLILLLGPVPMPWLSLGNTQAMSGLVKIFAPTIGSIGIGFLVVLGNLMIATGLERRRDRFSSRLGVALVIPAAILVAVFFHRDQITSSGQSIRLGILQPGFTAQKWAEIHDVSRVDSLLALSEFMLLDNGQHPDIVIWPETALPYMDDAANTEKILMKMSAWVKKNRIAILTGAITESDRFKSSSRVASETWFRNTVMFFDTTGNVTRHGKNILVPFAEYVPLSLAFPELTALAVPAGGVAGYLPEEVPSVFRTGDLSFGVMICFESAFPHYARVLARAGSKFLIVITQDGWWNSNTPRVQHFYYSRYRAAETGLSVVQVSVDGISGVIRPDGSVQIMTGSSTMNQSIVDIPLVNSSTFYTRFGDLMLILALSGWIVALTGVFVVSFLSNKPRNSGKPHH